ncbi:replication factor A protein 3 [Gongronella butleri]|nr:replication factor A protein 3 [Gongronella butleri]
MNKPTPRINSQLREKYAGTTVRIAGKIHSYTGETAVLSTSDGGQVLVKLNDNSKWGSEYIEIIGRVEPDFSITEFDSLNLGNDFDLQLANKVVEYGQKFPEMFQ